MRSALLLWIITFNVFAEYKCGTLMISKKDNEAADALHEYLKPRIQVLNRDMDMFHWRRKEKKSYEKAGLTQVGAVPPKEARAGEYLKEQAIGWWQEELWNKGHGLLVGNGLYTAKDPFGSSSYGGYGDDWALIVMSYKKGTKFIDLRTRIEDSPGDPSWMDPLYEGNRLKLTEKVHQALNAADCPVNLTARLQHSFFGNPKCDKFMKEVFCRENIKYFNHDWTYYKVGDCEKNGAAFNVVDFDSTEPDSYIVLSKDLPAGNTNEEKKALKKAGFIYKYASEVGKTSMAEGDTYKILNGWAPQEKLSKVDEEKYKEWKSSLFGCGNHPEDSNTKQPEACEETPEVENSISFILKLKEQIKNIKKEKE